MEIILDGIREKERDNLKRTIIDIVKDVFGPDNSNIREIIIPNDFRQVVNSKHRRTKPDEEYITQNSTTLAKNFRVGDYCEIVLNGNSYMKNKELFFSTLYHEIVHAKFYYDIRNLYYSNLYIENIDNCDDNEEYVNNIIEIFTFKVIDEYNAYKKTFEKFPDIEKSYLIYTQRLNDYFLFFNNSRCKWFSDHIDYLNKITTALSIVFALRSIHENVSSDILQNFDIYLKKLFELLHDNKNGIPQNEDFSEAKKYIETIFNLVDWTRLT
jgi:hypothetical protein